VDSFEGLRIQAALPTRFLQYAWERRTYAKLLDLVENFTIYMDTKGGTQKIVAKNHQYLGVNNAIASMLKARELGHGRGGVFWQTQGSGKTYTMAKTIEEAGRPPVSATIRSIAMRGSTLPRHHMVTVNAAASR
jgi:hypothetical protein